MIKTKTDLDLSDKLENIKAYSEKADFVLGLIQSDFTGWITNGDSLKVWNNNRDTVCGLIDIVSDYVINVSDGLRELLDAPVIRTGCGKDGGGVRGWQILNTAS